MAGIGAMIFGAPKLSDAALEYMAIEESPYLQEIMARKDQREWEQKRAIEAASRLGSNPQFKNVEGSAQIDNNSIGLNYALDMFRSGDPTLQKIASEMIAAPWGAVNNNFTMTQEQKNAYSAAPQNPQGYQRIMQMQTDPAYAINAAGANRLRELQADYGYKSRLSDQDFNNRSRLGTQDFNNASNLELNKSIYKGLGTAPTAETIGGIGNSKFNDAYNKKMGEAVAQAKIDLPKVIDSGNYMLNILNAAKTHPGMSSAVGVKGVSSIPMYYGGEPIQGSDAAGFKTIYDQIKGGAFLEAFKTLKGGGQITEVEGKKATDAINRINTATKESDFIAAVDDFSSVVTNAMERAKKEVSGDYTPAEIKSNKNKLAEKVSSLKSGLSDNAQLTEKELDDKFISGEIDEQRYKELYNKIKAK